ncbi:Uncharacterised protein [Mycobacteroides abscessus subsp. abscessus]|nr:Uncharacterised protein [Mycobacteroides abscessus subsp. abscessus]
MSSTEVSSNPRSTNSILAASTMAERVSAAYRSRRPGLDSLIDLNTTL